jgi:hypothetical protein
MDTNLQHLALVSETKHLSLSELGSVSAALQKQVLRDFFPIWDIHATVDVFDKLDDVPLDYWPMIVRDDIQVGGAAGIHEDKDGHPFALIQYSEGWSLTASHECLEMLGDPGGNRVKAGSSPMAGQERVEFLVEVCDPSESDAYAYAINGVTVSDFYTPQFFAPAAAPGMRFSFTGAIEAPREVLPGGYLSWHDPVTDHWFQEIFFAEEPQFRDLGVLAQGARSGPGESAQSIRRQIYNLSPEVFEARRRRATTAPSGALRATAARAGFGAGGKAKALRAQIDALLAKR